ncbi:MAG TPA: phosphatidylglycerophosphatase A [Bacteroidota bacterium]
MNGTVPHPEAPDGSRVPFAVRLIATGFYTGYIPWASGTFGSFAGLLLFLIPGACGATGVTTGAMLPVLLALGFGVGVYTAGRVAEAEGNRLSRSAALAKAMFQPAGHAQSDPSIVVIDEIVGMWISLAGIGAGPAPFITAFILFRLFDVLKPEPARSLERLPRGWGIMLDDVVAGVYANAGTRAVLFLWALFVNGGGMR